jgi:hypothetical protein
MVREGNVGEDEWLVEGDRAPHGVRIARKTMYVKAARNGGTWGRNGRLASVGGRRGWLRRDSGVREGNGGEDEWLVEGDRAHKGVQMAIKTMHWKAARTEEPGAENEGWLRVSVETGGFERTAGSAKEMSAGTGCVMRATGPKLECGWRKRTCT